MVETIHVAVANRWDAVALLNAFADRGSYVVNRGDHYDLRVICDPAELEQRLGSMQATPTMSCVLVRQSSGALRTVALAPARGR